MNVFRKAYRPLNDDEKAYLEALKNKAQELYDLISLYREHDVMHSRETALAQERLEESIMWAVKDVTR